MKKQFRLVEGQGQLVDLLPFSDGEYNRRLMGLRDHMRAENIDYFISFTPENIFYMTGHDTPGYYFYQACIVGMAGRPVNILRRIELENTTKNSWSRLAVAFEDREDPVDATLWYLLEEGLAGKTVAMESEAFFVSPQRYNALVVRIQAAGGKVVERQFVELLRVAKSQEEIRYIRQAAMISAEAMQAGLDVSAIGCTEDMVAAAVMQRLTACGSEYGGMPPLIMSSPRSTLCHATWSGRTLRFGDVLGYEVPAVRRRYCAVMYRTGTMGKPSAEVQKFADVSRSSLEKLVELMKPGNIPEELHAASQANMKAHGCGDYVGHRSAYSLGVNYPPDWGEGQLLSMWPGEKRPLVPGMVFHVIPGIYVKERFFVAISDTVLVTETGAEVLTNFSRELFVVSGR